RRRAASAPWRNARDGNRGLRAAYLPAAPAPRRHPQALDLLHVQPVASPAAELSDLELAPRAENRLPLPRRGVLVHRRRPVRLPGVGLRGGRDGSRTVSRDVTPGRRLLRSRALSP